MAKDWNKASISRDVIKGTFFEAIQKTVKIFQAKKRSVNVIALEASEKWGQIQI